MARKKARLLVRIGKARVYGVSLDVSPHLRYLDVAALKGVRRLELPIGSAAIPGCTVSIAAVVKRGIVTELRPTDCPGCETTGRSRRPRGGNRKALARAVHEKLEALGGQGTPAPMPMPVARLARHRIPVTVIVVITPDGVLCVRIEIAGRGCLYCQDGTTCWRPSGGPPVE